MQVRDDSVEPNLWSVNKVSKLQINFKVRTHQTCQQIEWEMSKKEKKVKNTPRFLTKLQEYIIANNNNS